MLGWIRDTHRALATQARTRRLVAEQVLRLTESAAPISDADEADWTPLGGSSKSPRALDADTLRRTARRLVREQPYAANLLRLLDIYVAGAEPHPSLQHRPGFAADARADAEVTRLWEDFLAQSAGHWSIREHARRTWRDGECFVRKFATDDGPAEVRFVDPERIGCVAGHESYDGLVPQPGDAESPRAYLKRTADGQLDERIDAAEMLHSKVGVDSNELRGRSVLEPLAACLERYDSWLDIELQARKLQASIVLWRKVNGSPQAVADSAAGPSLGMGMRREAVAAGTIVTTGATTDLQFLQPQTNFGDAVPLGRMLLLSAAAAGGVPEFMLTADASNANFASTMVAEGPAVKLFQTHQRWLAGELTRLWRWIIADAVDAGRLPSDTLDRVAPRWTFPDLVTRDRPAERHADVELVQAGILSRAEVARRDGVDPEVMEEEGAAAFGGVSS